MDLLSHLLSGLRFEQLNIAQFQLSAPWGINTEGYATGFSLIVQRGDCWLSQGGGQRTRFSQGDSVVVPRGGFIEFSSSPSGPTDDLIRVFGEETVRPLSANPPASVLRPEWGGNGELCEILGLTFVVMSNTANDFHQQLPAFMPLHAAGADTPLVTDSLASYLTTTSETYLPGEFAQKARMAEAIVISQIRHYILNQDNTEGITAGLRHPHIQKALAAIYSRFHEPWSVASLAREAGMSRAVFAKKFHALMGVPPMDYLMRWRVGVACQRLVTEDIGINQLASDLGFGSELSLRRNFVKVTQVTPRQWRTKNNRG